MSRSEQSHRTSVCSAIVAITVVLALIGAAGAHAGTYVINNCPSAGNGNAGSWSVFGSPQNVKGTCSGGSGDYIGPRGGSMSPGAFAGVQIAAPSGITIREAKIWWQASHQVSGADTFAVAYDSGGVVAESTTPLGAGNPDTFVLSSTTTELTLANYCSNDDYGNGCTFGGGENNILELYGAQLTLFDSGLPSGSVTGGSLSGAGPVSGTQSLAYNAADGGSGVRYVEVVVDGQSVAKTDYIAECPYQNFAACPANVSGTISWNTGSVTDGQHEIALRIVNAGGNSSIVDEHTITVENGPLPVPHIANGQSPCAGESLSITVDGKAKPATVPYGRAVTIRGFLHCGSTPIRDASIQVTTVAGPSHAAIDGKVQSGPDGSFSYKVPTGPDRTLRFAYTAYSNDSSPAASSTVVLHVRPRISLHITPRHTANGRSMHWSGTIGPGPYPSQGVTLVTEVQEGRHRWKAFAQVVTDAKGRFRYSYRFHDTPQPTTYTFRISLPDTGAQGYPYTPGSSNSVKVHVDP